MKSCTSFVLATSFLLAACSGTSSPNRPGNGSLDEVVLPEQPVVSPPPGTDSAPPPAAGDGGADTGVAVGAQYELPNWTREDVQPKSDRFGTMHGLETYRGKAIVVVLLEGLCNFCRSNSLVAQELQDALNAEGLNAQIVILSDPNAVEFASRVSLPIFRDMDGKAWEAMRVGARKHDTFVFAPNGQRTYFWLGSYQGDASRWRTEVGAAVREVAQKK